MAQLISSDDVERCLRLCLEAEGYELSTPRKHGEMGVDLIARKRGRKYFIEVIGFKKSGPARSKDFYEVLFRAVSRIKEGAKSIVIAFPEGFCNGLNQRASQYGEAWRRIGNAFPELKIWLVNCEHPYSYKQTSWNSWLTQQSLPDTMKPCR
jgi:Holliday junction resolvase-like predicted endonuclease